jgi:hypothetical protein
MHAVARSPINNRKIANHQSKVVGYQRHISHPPAPRYPAFMSTATGTAKFRCIQCEKPEDQCECEKYCVLCQSQLDIRICKDGLMYCEPCRNACDYKTSD